MDNPTEYAETTECPYCEVALIDTSESGLCPCCGRHFEVGGGDNDKA